MRCRKQRWNVRSAFIFWSSAAGSLSPCCDGVRSVELQRKENECPCESRDSYPPAEGRLHEGRRTAVLNTGDTAYRSLLSLGRQSCAAISNRSSNMHPAEYSSAPCPWCCAATRRPRRRAWAS